MMPNILTYTIGTLAALFPIANPIGAVPIFYSLTAKDTRSERRYQARRTAINVILILAVFLIGGRTILEFFGISLNVLRIAGGLLVANAAWEMVTSRQRLTDSEQQAGSRKGRYFVYPYGYSSDCWTWIDWSDDRASHQTDSME
jgi:multiple antibiotic resistance protein